MKAQVFLNLVGETLTTQQDYFTARKAGSVTQYNLLIKSKGLEKRVMAVVKEGRLEPDDVEAQVVVPTQILFIGDDDER